MLCRVKAQQGSESSQRSFQKTVLEMPAEAYVTKRDKRGLVFPQRRAEGRQRLIDPAHLFMDSALRKVLGTEIGVKSSCIHKNFSVISSHFWLTHGFIFIPTPHSLYALLPLFFIS